MDEPERAHRGIGGGPLGSNGRCLRQRLVVEFGRWLVAPTKRPTATSWREPLDERSTQNRPGDLHTPMTSCLVTMLLLGALPQPAPDTVVVCPADFQQSLQPWVDHRRQQGHVVRIVSSTGKAESVRHRIREVGKAGGLRFVVLIGDVGTNPARCVPTHHAKAKVNVRWGSEPHIATDNWYADLDDDQLPDVAIGRLTADTPGQLQQIVAKILAYERSTDFGPWRRRLNFVAGVGGFGALADKVIESTARHLLTRNIPADYHMSMTYGSWRSPFCPDPRRFHEATMASLGEGAWFWVYIGHGYHLALDRVRVPDTDYHILGVSDVPKLKLKHGPPIAMFLACYTGAFDATDDCLAERMLAEPDGPVAIFAGSRVTMPYAMTIMGTGLMSQCFTHRPATLGEAILEAKRAMVRPADPKDKQRTMIDTIAAVVSSAPKQLAEERAEHILLFNLIGDPLLQLHYPRRIDLEVAPKATSGERLTVVGTSSINGPATAELVVRRDRLTFSPPGRSEFPVTSGALAAFQEIYERANNRCLTSVETTITNGTFSLDLEIPPHAHGPCHVRLFVQDSGGFATGSADVEITRLPRQASATGAQGR